MAGGKISPPYALDRELKPLADEASGALQKLQTLMGGTDRPAGRVEFPRGFLIAVGTRRLQLKFVRRNKVRNNVAYAMLLHDIYRWLLIRTDIAGLARDMLVKADLTAMGSIAEALIRDRLAGKMGARHKYTSRTKRLFDDALISEQLKHDLDWLWEMRCRQHLFELDVDDFNFYKASDHARAVRAVRGLLTALGKK